jgi:V8-like Glu-specific endopeptidase
MRGLVLALGLIGALSTSASAETAAPLVPLETLDAARGWEAVGKLILGERGFCTGALISPDLVLTAAHCLYDRETGARLPTEEITFLAGWQNGRAEAYRGVRQAVTDPDYVYGASDALDRVAEDVALLELDQPIRLESVRPFAVGGAPGAGEPVDVVSYAQERADVPSLEDGCRVMERQAGILVMTCDVDFGASGAPVFRMGPRGPEIVSVVSAKAEYQGRKVSLGSGLDVPVRALTLALGAERPGRVQMLSGQREAGGAKFLRPEARQIP